MKSNNRVEKFLEEDFGVGGLSNYTPEQSKKVYDLMATLFGNYNDNPFSCAEISSIRDFLTSLNTDTESEPLWECFSEAQELGLEI